MLPNPDLIYPTAEGGFGIASASVALLFEAALELRYPGRPELRFERLGKPHPAMFEEARRRSGTSDMVMIGDQPETDIRGANAFGIHSALVDTGIAGPATATAAAGAAAHVPPPRPDVGGKSYLSLPARTRRRASRIGLRRWG